MAPRRRAAGSGGGLGLYRRDYEAVRFFMPFNDFNPPPIPRGLDTYLEFRRLSIEFTEARNRRIHQLTLDVD